VAAGEVFDSYWTGLKFLIVMKNIHNWQAQLFLFRDPSFTRKFYYPASVTLGKRLAISVPCTGDARMPAHVRY